MKYWGIFLLILIVPLVSSLDVTFECPKDADYQDELSCFIDAQNVEDVYDVKFYITGEGKGGINRIFDGEEYRRADWYVKELINESGYYEVKLLIHKDYTGLAYGEFKLRDSAGKIALLENFEMDIGLTEEEPPQEVENGTDDTPETEVEIVENNSTPEEFTEEEPIVEDTSPAPKKVINLNSQEDFEGKDEEVVYQSKNKLIKDTLVYAFIVFLILVIGFLLFERKW